MEPVKSEPFRLLDLPQEIQDRIYEKHFEEANPTVEFAEWLCPGLYPSFIDSAALKLSGLPDLSVECVSRKVFKDARAARERSMTTTIDFKGPKEVEYASMLLRFGQERKTRWLSGRATCIRLDEGDKYFRSYPEDWSLILGRFPKLRHVAVRFCSYEFKGIDDQVDNIMRGGPAVDEIESRMQKNAVHDRNLVDLARAMKSFFGDGCSVTSQMLLVFRRDSHLRSNLRRTLCKVRDTRCFYNNLMMMLTSVRRKWCSM